MPATWADSTATWADTGWSWTAAVNAKERTRLPVSESPSVRDSPRE